MSNTMFSKRTDPRYNTMTMHYKRAEPLYAVGYSTDNIKRMASESRTPNQRLQDVAQRSRRQENSRPQGQGPG
jgi:hypothetical protein